jgi:RNA polymerase sigma-70 factor (ECF subfamily)
VSAIPDEQCLPADDLLIRTSLSAPEAFTPIFERHFDAVRGYVVRRVGLGVADDIAAETFVVAFGQRARFDAAAGSARAWLLGIATNLIRRHHRQEARALRAWSRTGVDPLMGDHADAVVSRVDAGEQMRQLAGKLAELSPRDRDTLLLLAWGGLSQDEVAAALSVPVGTVRSRLHRIRGQLRTLLPSSGTESDR